MLGVTHCQVDKLLSNKTASHFQLLPMPKVDHS